MKTKTTRRLRRCAWALPVGAALAALCCGCTRGPAREDVSALEVARYRLNVDDAHRVARVMGEMRNNGKTGVEEAVVIGALRGPGEEAYGSGQTSVRDIKPGGTRLFSLRIDAKGDERDVEFFILSPEKAQSASPGDQAGG